MQIKTRPLKAALSNKHIASVQKKASEAGHLLSGRLKQNHSGVKKLKKRVTGGAVAGVVAAGVLLSGLFGSPAELTDRNIQNLTSKQPVVRMVDMDVEEEDDNDDGDAVTTKKKRKFGDRLKERILGLPVLVRALVGVPLWAIGWGITNAVDLLWQASAPTVVPILIKLAVILLVLFGVVFLTTKALHPDWPVKKILKKMFQKRNLLFLIIGAAVLTAADTVLIAVWDGYDFWRRLIIFAVGLFLLFLLLRPFIAKAIRNKRDQERLPDFYRRQI